jgi:uncharacterized protein with NAD-binding domain and iron-sulfur cluster
VAVDHAPNSTSGDGAGKTRVAIIGGGPAALAAAFELTATPELAARHEITIYQPGWRLGGKCASGRNKAVGSRIEEHGLHVWFGCYDNAFSIIRRCYAERARLRGSKGKRAMSTWRQAFKPCHEVVVWERGEDWRAHALRFPPTPGVPGAERHRELSDVLRDVLGWIDVRLRELISDDPEVGDAAEDAPRLASGLLERACQAVEVEFERVEHLGVWHLVETAARLAERHLEREGRGLAADAAEDLDLCVNLLGQLAEWVAEHFAVRLPGHPDLQFVARTVDMALAAVRGILVDRLMFRGFDAINDWEFGAWLAHHGARVDTEDPEQNSAFLRGVYDGSFAFLGGDPRQPNMAAGRALQGAIRCLFHYNGAVLWRMQAGMGDTVIAPLYEVLSKRDVRFAFFHAAAEVRSSDDGKRVEEIDVIQQVAMRDGDYSPLIDVEFAGKPLPCWPDRPIFKQLVGGRAKRVRAGDFEHAVDPLGTGERTTLKADRDFDVAILAVPPPVQKEICAPLRQASTRYDAMLRGVKTVITQAAQLWLDRTPEQLGWEWDSNSLMSMYVEPIDTYCDMSHLLRGERWPRDRVHHVAYFCGVIGEEDVGDVQRFVGDFLVNDVARFWPKVATEPDGTGFDWARLVAPDELEGPARLSAQYLRTNHQASEQYVLTAAGTVDTRLWPHDRCFENLVFAGDWTRNGFDAGCVEGAMTSGMLAAQAICGHPKDSAIAGLNGPAGFPNGPGPSGEDGGRGRDASLLGLVEHGVEQVVGVLLWGARGVVRRIWP